MLDIFAPFFFDMVVMRRHFQEIQAVFMASDLNGLNKIKLVDDREWQPDESIGFHMDLIIDQFLDFNQMAWIRRDMDNVTVFFDDASELTSIDDRE